MDFAFRSSRILTQNGPIPASVIVEGERIAGLGGKMPSGVQRLDAGDFLILPGIVDIHGDAFERQIMPRPGVTFPLPMALADTDAQLLSSGITTAFHGITYSWEPGLRGAESTRRVVGAVHELRDRMRCDTRIHLRFETYNLEALDEIAGWIEQGIVDLLGFNDHVPHYLAKLAGDPDRLSDTAKRAGMGAEAFADLVHEIAGRSDLVPQAVECLAAVAAAHHVPTLSHDDETPEIRHRYHRLGCRIAEFPVDAITAQAAVDLGDEIVLGAPNILRGGSHCGRLSTREAIAGGHCTILASDYYYPSLLHSAFALAADGGLDLADIWRMVSESPARAAGLTDRGAIAEGRRADLIVVDDSEPMAPRVMAVCVGGRIVHASGSLARDAASVSCAA